MIDESGKGLCEFKLVGKSSSKIVYPSNIVNLGNGITSLPSCYVLWQFSAISTEIFGASMYIPNDFTDNMSLIALGSGLC